MARFTYGANNVEFQTYNSWSNALDSSDTTNIAASTAYSELIPDQSGSYAASFLQNSSMFYGSLVGGHGGNVSITAPYTVSATKTITVKNINITNTSISIEASTSYPYVFNSWRTAASGSGTAISTNASLTITDNTAADHDVYYAHFTTTHVDPP
tara:strand:+ start:141 stop:605 length:465 start_codon:yes stop_codon:yes gene_type:complete